MNTSIQELENWMGVPRENEHLEFKEAKNQFDLTKLFRYCVAMANEGGGKLILGVNNKIPRKVIDSKAFRDIENIATKIFAKLHFRVDAEELNHPDGRVIIFHIPSRPKGTAYQFEGAYLMRSTEDTVPMSEDRLRQIFDEGKPDWPLRIAKNDCSADEIIKLLDTQGYFDLLKLMYPTTRDAVLKRFEQEKFIQQTNESWNITNLGAILFAKSIDDFDLLSRKAPRVIIYEGVGKIKTKLDKLETKGYAVGFEGLLDFINSQIPTNEVIQRALRKEKKMFPEIAIRELVANALIHQDLNEVGPILIEIYSNRMEITNPGCPYISPERFIDEYGSRNERLADIMRRIGICEEKGSGVDKVIDATEVYQLPAPDFRVGEKHTTVVLFSHKPFEKMDRNDRIRACYQHCCLRYVMHNQGMTNQSLRNRFKLAESKTATISQVIADAVSANLVKLDNSAAVSRRYAKYLPFWA